MRRHQPIVVEFVGRAGVGKSAIARHVESMLVANGFDCRRTVPRAQVRLLHPATVLAFLTALRLSWRYQLLWSRNGVLVAIGLVRELVRLHWSHHMPEHVVLLDQGLFLVLEHAKRARFEHRKPPVGSYWAAMRNVQLPHLVVYVTAAPEALAERRRLHRDAGSLTHEIWHSRHNTIAADLAHLKEGGSDLHFDFVVVDNEQSADVVHCARLVVARLLDSITGSCGYGDQLP